PALRPIQRFGGEAVRSKARVRLTTPTPPLQTTSNRIPVRLPSPAKTPVKRASTTIPRAWDNSRGWQDQSRVSNRNQRLKTTSLYSIVPLTSAAIRRAFDASVDQLPWLGGGHAGGLQSPAGQPARRHGGTAAGADPSPDATGGQWPRPGLAGAGLA